MSGWREGGEAKQLLRLNPSHPAKLGRCQLLIAMTYCNDVLRCCVTSATLAPTVTAWARARCCIASAVYLAATGGLPASPPCRQVYERSPRAVYVASAHETSACLLRFKLWLHRRGWGGGEGVNAKRRSAGAKLSLNFLHQNFTRLPFDRITVVCRAILVDLASCARGDTMPRLPPPLSSPRGRPSASCLAEQTQRSNPFPCRIRCHADRCSRVTR